MNKEKLQKHLDGLKSVHWRFVLMTAGMLSALIIVTISLLYFMNSDGSPQGLNETRLALRSSLNGIGTFASDYDNDKVLEPLPASDLDGKANGGVGYFIPPTVNVKRTNTQGKPYIYCAWDFGSNTNPARYNLYKNRTGEVEVLANPAPTTIVMALVDPGPNGKYETRCDAITGPRTSLGDDIVETLNMTDADQLATQKVGAVRKNTTNCAFGLIYTWNEVKQGWECKAPSAEQTAAIPAGCPTGQVLVERNKKIRCETIDKVSTEETATMPNTSANIATSTPEGTKNGTTNNAVKTEDGTDNVVLPAAAGQPARPNSDNTNNAQTTGTATTTFVDQQPSTVLMSAAGNNSANAQQDQNASIQQKIQQAKLPKRNLLVRTPSPGEAIGAAYEDDNIDIDDSEDRGIISGARGGNLLQNQAGENSASNKSEPALEMEIKKRKRKYKLKSCNPWMYLPRSTGVVNQCIRANAFGDLFGNVARTTSWPAARSFLLGAFIFCPVGNFGEKKPCAQLLFDKNLFVTRTPPSVFERDGFICARMINPLPAPWPQFESFIYSEGLPNGPHCRIDQVPFFDKSSQNPQVMCLDLTEVIDSYNHNGYCGCGWSLIWNAQAARLQCS